MKTRDEWLTEFDEKGWTYLELIDAVRAEVVELLRELMEERPYVSDYCRACSDAIKRIKERSTLKREIKTLRKERDNLDDNQEG